MILYVQVRLLWNLDLEVEDLIEEYYEKFHGPVADEMREALEFAQTNYSRSNVNPRLVALSVRIKFALMIVVGFR